MTLLPWGAVAPVLGMGRGGVIITGVGRLAGAGVSVGADSASGAWPDLGAEPAAGPGRGLVGIGTAEGGAEGVGRFGEPGHDIFVGGPCTNGRHSPRGATMGWLADMSFWYGFLDCLYGLGLFLSLHLELLLVLF